MRCRNCGWDNDEYKTKCEKCNAVLLRPVEIEEQSTYRKESEIHKIVPQSFTKKEEEHSEKNTVSDIDCPTCPECNYPLFPDNKTCPMCNAALDIRQQYDRKTTILNDRKTVNPWDLSKSVSCHLKIIQSDEGKTTPEVLTFSGESIILNRANTDANNITITSKEQALLSYEDEKWYIQDKSEQKTTFIRTSDKVEIKPGDIIMLGNRRFEFE